MRKKQLITLLGAGVIVVLVVTAFTFLYKKPITVHTFEECKNAGGAVMESYPERCMIDGATFTNTSQSNNGEEYIGLTEADTLAKAKKDNVAARVVERDGESLPVTMDFNYGRHNLHIKDGKVYSVDIEGQAEDQ